MKFCSSVFTAVCLCMCISFMAHSAEPMQAPEPAQAPIPPQYIVSIDTPQENPNPGPKPRKRCNCWLGSRCVCGDKCNCPDAYKPKTTPNLPAIKRRIIIGNSFSSRAISSPAPTMSSPITMSAMPVMGCNTGGCTSAMPMMPLAPRMTTGAFTPSFGMMNSPVRGGFFRGSMGGGMRMGGGMMRGGGGCTSG